MIEEICSICGLPNELCVCDQSQKDSSLIEIKIEKRKYGKLWAIVLGINVESPKLKLILKNIKNKLACGGTVKGKSLEILFGKNDRIPDLIKVLVDEGFNRDSIHITSK